MEVLNRKRNLNKIAVRSIFFPPKSTVMDESSDFQEKKKSVVGPKNNKQIKISKPKSQKIKRIKGQKDIRTALNSKKSNLLSYTEEFHNVCVQSGLDVDAEQLQLAIALSKSIQTEINDSPSQICEPKNSQESVKKIRTTLLEYGFKVPDIKINPVKKKRQLKKFYKLLVTSETERRQLIADRFSQILLQNNFCFEENIISKSIESSLYKLATNITYDTLKDVQLFYIENLIEVSPNSIGSLLKDWAEIPGRPLSPTKNSKVILMSDIECSMSDVDSILSGSIETTQYIMKSKYKCQNETDLINLEIIDVDNDNFITKLNESSDFNVMKKKNSVESDTIQSISISSLKIPNSVRSLSPDIFDEDVSTVEENENIKLPPEEADRCEIKQYETMDLTECIPIDLKSYTRENLKISQSNITRRDSDVMEITDCVVRSSQPIRENKMTDKIDLTQDISILCADEKEKIMDLTQSSNSNDDTLPYIEIHGKEPVSLSSDFYNEKLHAGTTVDKKYNENTSAIAYSNCKTISTSLQTSNINGSIFEEYQYDHSDKKHKVTYDIIEENFNLTQSLGKSLGDHDNDFLDQPNINITLSENHSNTLGEQDSINNIESNDNIDLTQSSDEAEEVEANFDINKKSYSNNNFGKKDDLSIDYDEIIQDCVVVNDTLIEDNFYEQRQSNEELLSRVSQVFEISDNEFNYSINQSRREVDYNFDINEISLIDNKTSFQSKSNLNHSLDEQNDISLPNVNIGTEKVIKTNEEIAISTTNSQHIHSPLVSNDILNTIKTPSNTEYIFKTDQVTPIVDYESMSTPERNRELKKFGLKPFKRKRAIQLLTHLYNQTHPIVDSQSGYDGPSSSKKVKQNTSPKRTISPNKSKSPRKIFNSPSKNTEKCSTKPSSASKNISPRKSIDSPSKNTESIAEFNIESKTPRKRSPVKRVKNIIGSPSPKSKVIEKSLEISEKENIYEVTNELPDLINFDCCDEDWIFQKREKAKLQTCRLPLHIAFHNYVTTRQRLFESILRYEPINIDKVHKDLATYGHRYDPKDLLKFLDKKCITVKTADNNVRNKR